jgi:hypothetical protein
MTRICITGGPRTGKTTLATDMRAVSSYGGSTPFPLRHTDDLIPLGWSEASQAAALWLDEPGPWIIEGVAVSRALRKWRDQHPGERPPVDRVIRLTEPHIVLTHQQAVMSKGEETVWNEVGPWLFYSGVPVVQQADLITHAHQHPRLTDAP